MTAPPPEVCLHAFRHLVQIDQHREPSASTAEAMMEGLTEDEADALPEAFKQGIKMLAGDPDRLRAAAELAAAVDLFEAAGEVTRIAKETGDGRIALAAATLCGNPAADQHARASLHQTHGSNLWVRVRYDPDCPAESSEQERLKQQLWPGLHANGAQPLSVTTPLVLVDMSLPSNLVLGTAARLASAGASVRRLRANQSSHQWLGELTSVVGTKSTLAALRISRPDWAACGRGVPAGDGASIDQLLSTVDSKLPDHLELYLRHRVPIVDDLLTRDMYDAGAYSSRDAAYLCNMKPSDWSRMRRILSPKDSWPRGTIWSFGHVVAGRMWSHLRSKVKPIQGRRTPLVLAEVARLSRLIEERIDGDFNPDTEIGLAAGRILINDDGTWRDEATEQTVMEGVITSADAAFDPFKLGRLDAIGLPVHKDQTATIPTVLDGAPHQKGHRISAKSIARAHTLGSNGVSGSAYVESVYPQLRGVQYDATLEVGRKLVGRS